MILIKENIENYIKIYLDSNELSTISFQLLVGGTGATKIILNSTFGICSLAYTGPQS
jgi:hypothetical protein